MNSFRRIFLHAVVLCSLLPLSGKASDAWVDREVVGRFEVRSEVPVRQSPVLREFVRSLPSLESDITSTLGLQANQKPIAINVFQTRLNYQSFIARRAPEGQGRRALYVQSETHGSVYVYLHADVMTDLCHETTHAILHSSLAFVPLWLDEGLAEYFEIPSKRRESDNPHLSRTRLDARLIVTWRPSLVRLEAIPDQSGMSLRSYRESWAWVHFLLHGPDEAVAVLPRYLSGIESHDPPDPLSVQLRLLWPDPERQLTSHFRSWK